MPYPTKPKGGMAAATPGGRQQVHGAVAGDKGYQEVHEQVPGNIPDEYGAGIQQPSGTLPLSRGWENICISTRRNAKEHSVEPSMYEKMQKDCKAEGIDIPKTMMAKDPVAHMMTPQEYLQKVAAGQMPKMNNHEMMVELAAKNDQTQLLMMEFRDVETPKNK